MRSFIATGVLVVSLAGLSVVRAADVVYTNDFDSPAVTSFGATATLTGGALQGTLAPYVATYGNVLRSDSNVTPIELTLTGLPAHTGVNLDFVMALLDSWDSRDGSPSPDNLDLYIDGALFASYTYNNASGTIADIGGGALIGQYVQFDATQFFTDSVADMANDPALTFPHTAGTLTVAWIASGSGWQGPGDEAYGVDNVRVELLGIPEPATFLIALTCVAGANRRRR
ncbi:MAG: hypothetical protein ACRCT8_18200 [Lacipirellulaceae bacterium]